MDNNNDITVVILILMLINIVYQPDLVREVGYPAETHYATTEDGYILALHRIPGGRKGGGRLSGAVCYLQHGLMCSSADWVIPTPSKGLGKNYHKPDYLIILVCILSD